MSLANADTTTTSLSLKEQAEFVEELAGRTTMMDGTTAGETCLYLTASEAQELRALAARLRRIAPWEGEIRAMVASR